MSESLELQRDVTPMQLMQLAIEKEGSIDVIERLAKLQREQIEYHAMVEFNRGMHRCQQQMKRIATDMENPQTRSRYASYAQIDRTIRPIYTEEGFSLSFGDGEPIAPDFIRIICYVSHVDGHTRMYHKDMPIITTGPKGNDVMTKVHAHGSADQYAKRYLVKDIFNLAIGEDDDDGNGGLLVSEAIAKTVSELLRCADMETLKEQYRREYKAAVEANDSTAVKLFMDAYNKRKGELA
jgi:hypothetical protein